MKSEREEEIMRDSSILYELHIFQFDLIILTCSFSPYKVQFSLCICVHFFWFRGDTGVC